MQTPDYLKAGQVARLFPVISETGKEQRTASIFLAVVSAVPPLANAIFSQIGQKVGLRSSINTYTEVVFQSSSKTSEKDRPDGLIEINTGRKTWRALIEAKISQSKLDKEQIERYLRIARENSIDAVITFSNEFAALPSHHPICVNKMLTRKVSLYHFSWKAVLTEAVLMHEQSAISDTEQAFLLREFIRFLSHDSAGVTGYTSMPKEWKDAVEKIKAGGNIPKTELGEAIVWGWHQELKDLSLIASRIIGCNTSVKLSRIHANDPATRTKDDLENLCSNGVLEAELSIPNAADELKITADLRCRSLRVAMKLDAPKDKKSSKARLNWLLRQLKEVASEGISISIIWASRAPDTDFTLEELRCDPNLIETVQSTAEVRAFRVTLTSNSGRRFVGRKTVIEDLEMLVPSFYERVGQFLQTWKPPAPKPKHKVAPNDDQKGSPSEEMPLAGNSHSELLEIPAFLERAAE